MKQEYIKVFKTVGENIKNVREEKGMTLEEISVKTGIREKYLKKIEKGEAFGFTATQLMKIACALKVKPHVLVEGL